MKLTSSAFVYGAAIPSLYTCDGKGVSPPLTFTDVPKEAKCLVLIMDDPDVPSSVRKECMWDHWVLFNIPPTVSSLKENTAPVGEQGQNTSGKLGYYGPCPPDREHRYFFKLYALDKMLPLHKGATKAEVEKAMQGHILATAELMGRYERLRRHTADS